MPPVGVPVIEVQPQSDVEGFSFERVRQPRQRLGAARGQRRRRRSLPAVRNRGSTPRGQDRRLRRRRLQLPDVGLCPCRAAQPIPLGRGRHHTTDGAAHRLTVGNRRSGGRRRPSTGSATRSAACRHRSSTCRSPAMRRTRHRGRCARSPAGRRRCPTRCSPTGTATCRPTSPNSPSASTTIIQAGFLLEDDRAAILQAQTAKAATLSRSPRRSATST